MYAKNRKLAKRETPSKSTIDNYFPVAPYEVTTLSSDEENEEKKRNEPQDNSTMGSISITKQETNNTIQKISSSSIATSFASSSLRLKRKKLNPSLLSNQSEIVTPTEYNSSSSLSDSNKSITGSLEDNSLPVGEFIKGNEIVKPLLDHEDNQHNIPSSSQVEEEQKQLPNNDSIIINPVMKLEEEEFTKISRIEGNNLNDISALSSNNKNVDHGQGIIPSSFVEEEIQVPPTAFFTTFRDETVLIYHTMYPTNCEPNLLISKIRTKLIDLPKDINVKYWDDYVGGFVRFDKDVMNYIMRFNLLKVKLLISQK